MQKYFVSELYPHALFTAGVLRNDIEETLQNSAYTPLVLTITKSGLINKVINYLNTIRFAQRLTSADVVFFHFPIRSRSIRLFHTLSQKKGCKTIAYVHDFEGLRDQDDKVLQKEINQLAKFDYIIAQNEAMKEFIDNRITNREVVVLEMYDYLHLQEKEEVSFKLSNEICFAGNLSKAPFLSKVALLQNLQFYIYGDNTLGVEGKNIQFMNKVDPRKLPSIIKGSFGLVWDGSNIETGEDFGEYLKYNIPHKLALYLAAGLPVIVWNQSAMADWVIENEVGITISSVLEIESRINDMTEDQYLLIQQKIKPIQEKIKQGFYLQKALRSIESNLLN